MSWSFRRQAGSFSARFRTRCVRIESWPLIPWEVAVYDLEALKPVGVV